jgi:hypothetical protein
MPTDVFWVRQELRGAAREPVEAEAQQLCGAGVPGALLTGVGQRDRQGASWVHVPPFRHLITVPLAIPYANYVSCSPP